MKQVNLWLVTAVAVLMLLLLIMLLAHSGPPAPAADHPKMKHRLPT